MFTGSYAYHYDFPAFDIVYIYKRDRGRERGPGGIDTHHKVGTDFHNTLISRPKDLLPVPLGFACVSDRPDVPLDLQDAEFLQFLPVSSDGLL
jgi:hypothetical protein